MIRNVKCAIFDLDGTLFLGKDRIEGASEALHMMREKGIKILFLTNAGTRSREGVAEKLRSRGFEANADEVYCGSYIVAKYIAMHLPGKKVYVVGEPGMVEELNAAGIETSDDAGIVVGCLDRQINYEKLGKAHMLIRHGAEFIASNKDHTFPTEHGSMPGAGAIVAAIEFSTRRSALVVGKPNPYAFTLMKEEKGLKASETLMVGDRLDTDIAFAKNCGIKSVLVLTGTSKKEEIKEKGLNPELILETVAGLPKELGIMPKEKPTA